MHSPLSRSLTLTEALKGLPIESIYRGVATLQETLNLALSLLVDRASNRRMPWDDAPLLFYSSPPAICIYCLIVTAFVTRRWWMLYGVILVVMAQISWIVLKWILYILDDKELFENIEFAKTWADRILKEFDNLVTQKDATRIVLTSSALQACPIGVDVYRYLLRCKMHEVNDTMIEQYDKKCSAWSKSSSAGGQSVGVGSSCSLSLESDQSTSHHDD
jgi:hypothetical protein